MILSVTSHSGFTKVMLQNVYLSKMQNIATVVDDCAIIYGAQSKLEILIRFTEIKIPNL